MPSCRNAGMASCVVEMAISASTARTTSPQPRTSTRKKRSLTAKRPPRRTALPGVAAVGVPAPTGPFAPPRRRHRQTAHLGLGLVEDGGRELCVVDRAGDFLAFAVDEVEERFQRIALGLVGLGLVG